MSTFAALAARSSVGVAYYLKVSSDRFSTTSYYWGTNAGALDGTNQYEPRIVSIGALQRGLTQDNGFAAATVPVTLDNNDGSLDWMLTRSTVASTLLKTRFRLYIVLFDPADPTDMQSKLLGQFVCLDFPRRTASRVDLQLTDDALGDASDFSIPPSIYDWTTHGSTTTSSCPLVKTTGGGVDRSLSTWFIDYLQPLPLVFGGGRTKCTRVCVGHDRDTSNEYKLPLIVCATTNTAAVVTGEDVAALEVDLEGLIDSSITVAGGSPGSVVPIPAQWNKPGGAVTLWVADKTQSISHDGRNWSILFITVYMADFVDYLKTKVTFYSDPDSSSLLLNGHSLDAYMMAIENWYVYGYPYSNRTILNPPNGSPKWLGYSVTGPEIAFDLLAYYTKNLSTSDLDSTSFTNAAKARRYVPARGVIDDSGVSVDTTKAGAIVNAGRLRAALVELCQGHALDLTFSWSGLVLCVAQTATFDAQTSSLTALEEVLASDFADKIPSQGERWAPFNRVYVETTEGKRLGPYDHAANVTAWGVALTKVVSLKWLENNPTAAGDLANEGAGMLSQLIWNSAAFESKIRPVIEFLYPLDALNLEVGDYFTMSWSRGGTIAAPYSTDTFKVEGLTLMTSRCLVKVTAVWYADLRTEPPYLVDNETLLTRVSAAGGRTATVTDSSTSVVFSSGSLISDGVAAGDTLILKDATMAASNFTRNRCLKIASITNATTLVISDSDLDFDAPGGTAVAAWEIRRSAVTYHTSGTDPTNYPSGASMYGKVANSSGVYSDSSAANKLLEG